MVCLFGLLIFSFLNTYFLYCLQNKRDIAVLKQIPVAIDNFLSVMINKITTLMIAIGYLFLQESDSSEERDVRQKGDVDYLGISNGRSQVNRSIVEHKSFPFSSSAEITIFSLHIAQTQAFKF